MRYSNKKPSFRPRGVLVLLGLVPLLLLAFAAGAAADHHASDGTDGKKCVSDCNCAPGELCSPKSGTCGPAICPDVFDPVCGLDGKTYGHECEAHAAHIVVAHRGECAMTCGGIVGKQCPKGQVCDLPAGLCDGADLQGECKQRPDACTEQYDPVCGCDGKTYGNDCKRLQAGAQKAHDGKCAEEGQSSYGCQSDDDCPRGAYCDHPIGACEAPGRCESRPQICTRIFLPVCGCDGKTYPNACEAAAAGISVESDGACK